jgi:hypothetical protein
MLRTAKLILATTVGIACFTAGALAEDAPNCPGGNLKGTFSCTGPIAHPVCSEGPPWHCEHPPSTDPPKLQVLGDNGDNHLRLPKLSTSFGKFTALN